MGTHPGYSRYTDSEENIRRIAHFIRNHLPNTTRYDLLAFNNTCSTKYRRLGQVWSMEEESQIRKKEWICLPE